MYAAAAGSVPIKVRLAQVQPGGEGVIRSRLLAVEKMGGPVPVPVPWAPI